MNMDPDLQKIVDLFFEDPGHPIHNRHDRPLPRDYGMLYLLRRDVQLCLGWDPASGTRTNHEALLWPGGMVILAGIDLLAKFYEGDDTTKKGKIGQRFKDFVSEYFQPLSDRDKETIYQLRNSLLHSFGLYSRRGAQTYHFLLTAVGDVALVHQPSPGNYWIDLIVLHDRFEHAVMKYRADLERQPLLQRNFQRMFENHGAVWVSVEPARPGGPAWTPNFVSGGIPIG